MNNLQNLTTGEIFLKVKNGTWLDDETIRERLLEDGKYLSFENEKDDFLFVLYFVKQYTRRKGKITEATSNMYQRDLLQFLEFLYTREKPVRLFDIGMIELRDYQEYIGHKYAPATGRRKLTVLKSLLRFGFKYNYYSKEVDDYIKLPAIKSVRQERILIRTEVTLMFAELKKNPLNNLVGTFLFYTALRISELCQAKWGDVFSGIHGGRFLKVIGKGDKERIIKIRSDVWGLLLEYRASKGLSILIGSNPEEPLIVNSKDNPLNDRVVRYMIERAAKRAGIQKSGVSPHWFRHTSLTYALDGGADIMKVKKLAGHSDIRTTQGYLHPLEDEKEANAVDFITGVNI